MFKGLMVFIVLVAGWVAALWFGIAPDFAQWSPPKLAAIHALPPLFSGGMWLGWRRWRGNRAEARSRAVEAAAEKKRQAEAEEARKQAAAEERHRRFGCDCRTVAMAQVAKEENEAPLVDTNAGVYFSSFNPSEANVAGGIPPVVAHLNSGIHEALDTIYKYCSAAVSLPVYVVPPGGARADEFVGAVRTAQRALAEEEEASHDRSRELGQVFQFVDGRNVLGDIIKLFERTPGLSIIVLGSDSPWLRARRAGHEETATEADKPGQGVFALLLTHPELANADSGVPPEKKRDLLSLPVLARLHRPACAEVGGHQHRTSELARAVGGLMAQARRSAGFDEMPCAEGGEKKPQSAPECSWLVHNSGTSADGGTQMASVGAALLDNGLELDLLDEATNISAAAGDLGDARTVGMLALAVAKAAATRGSALCVEFCGNDALSLFVARAPRSGEEVAGQAIA